MAEGARQAGSLTEPTWIMADAQTAARGRQGRPWRSLEGNLAATLVLPPVENHTHSALRSFVAALGLYDACARLWPIPDAFALKWPNDVLLHGGKLSGILLERLGDGTLLIGIGVNLAAAPEVDELEPGAVRPVALRPETGVDIAPRVFLGVLAEQFADWDTRYAAQGFAPIREAWLGRAARLGQTIRARVGREEYQGTFETIDEAGQLILATPEGRRAIPAADIYF